MLKIKDQVLNLLRQKNNVLIALPKHPSLDAITAGLALSLALEKLQQKSKIVAADFSLLPNHSFLPKGKDIGKDLKALRKFIIHLDLNHSQVDELSYDIDNSTKKLNIYISPKNGFFETKDLSSSLGDFAYDVIFVLDAPDLESLGSTYEDNAEFFYHTPIVNIDHKAGNEQFGQINLLDLTATSTSEIIFELLKDLKENVIDEYIATNLLAGIISKTKSFKTNSVTPRSLAIASHLISSGARREDIVRHLYQSKPLSTLKLWGRTLARLKSAPDQKIVWSLLGQEDFAKTKAQEEELANVIDELIVNTPDAKIIFILYEKDPQTIKCLLSTPNIIDALQLFKEYHPQGSVDFTELTLSNSTLAAAEKIILDKIKSAL